MVRHGRICRQLVEDGTEQGQMLFWDETLKRWVHTEVDELRWDDVNKRVYAGGDVVIKGRLLAGGVQP